VSSVVYPVSANIRSSDVTFQKRQKEMKRPEKQRAKAERREQKGVAKRAAKEAQSAATPPSGPDEPNIKRG
jgi:hypothetical protein